MMNFDERAVPNITANFLMQEAKARYVFAKRYLVTNKTVLDLACGTGYGSQILTSKTKGYIGLDLNDEALSFAIKNYSSPIASYIKMDVVNTLFKNGSFESITAFEMIEHLENQELFLIEVTRLLSKNGLFVISTPNRLIQSTGETTMSPFHTTEFSPKELERLLKKVFTHVKIYGQRKNLRAAKSVESFMFSQKARQFLVKTDLFNLRKKVSKEIKEKLWTLFGGFVGRSEQENVKVSDFLFTQKNIDKSEYIIALCKK